MQQPPLPPRPPPPPSNAGELFDQQPTAPAVPPHTTTGGGGKLGRRGRRGGRGSSQSPRAIGDDGGWYATSDAVGRVPAATPPRQVSPAAIIDIQAWGHQNLFGDPLAMVWMGVSQSFHQAGQAFGRQPNAHLQTAAGQDGGEGRGRNEVSGGAIPPMPGGFSPVEPPHILTAYLQRHIHSMAYLIASYRRYRGRLSLLDMEKLEEQLSGAAALLLCLQKGLEEVAGVSMGTPPRSARSPTASSNVDAQRGPFPTDPSPFRNTALAAGPGVNPGMFPGTARGVDPRMTAGLPPGHDPTMRTGVDPRLDIGPGPAICPGRNVRRGEGVGPEAGPELVPGMAPRGGPGMDSQALPVVCPDNLSGTHPGMHPPIGPAMSSAMGLALAPGTGPGMVTGIIPGMSPGRRPGMGLRVGPGMCAGTASGTGPGMGTGPVSCLPRDIEVPEDHHRQDGSHDGRHSPMPADSTTPNTLSPGCKDRGSTPVGKKKRRGKRGARKNKKKLQSEAYAAAKEAFEAAKEAFAVSPNSPCPDDPDPDLTGQSSQIRHRRLLKSPSLHLVSGEHDLSRYCLDDDSDGDDDGDDDDDDDDGFEFLRLPPSVTSEKAGKKAAVRQNRLGGPGDLSPWKPDAVDDYQDQLANPYDGPVDTATDQSRTVEVHSDHYSNLSAKGSVVAATAGGDNGGTLMDGAQGNYANQKAPEGYEGQAVASFLRVDEADGVVDTDDPTPSPARYLPPPSPAAYSPNNTAHHLGITARYGEEPFESMPERFRGTGGPGTPGVGGVSDGGDNDSQAVASVEKAFGRLWADDEFGGSGKTHRGGDGSGKVNRGVVGAGIPRMPRTGKRLDETFAQEAVVAMLGNVSPRGGDICETVDADGGSEKVGWSLVSDIIAGGVPDDHEAVSQRRPG